MKNKTLREKFTKSVNLVRPLYKKVAFSNKSLVVDIESEVKLEGSDSNVSKCVEARDFSVKTVLFENKPNGSRHEIPGLCEIEQSSLSTKDNYSVAIHGPSGKSKLSNIMAVVGSSFQSESVDSKVVEETKRPGTRDVNVQKARDYWLRVYPAPMLHGETYSSLLLRCMLCQLGLMTLLVIWTIIWIVVIYSTEAPYETTVSLDFQKKQNQLVIDLATELRQITPVSPKWRAAIEQRIEAERTLTEAAVGHGARFDSGRFWNLPGTFLFTIYVMTALGFGAPVPNTLFGRISSFVYAVFAVPAHIYLTWNASASFIAHLENCTDNMNERRNKRRQVDKNGLAGSSDANTELEKSPSDQKRRNKLISWISILCICRGIPLAVLLYYSLGAISFGVLRSRAAIDAMMFPLEFTTTGGLEHVEGFTRVIYGFYVQGAMLLLACALATLRRHSGDTLTGIGEKYRLFTFDKAK